VENVPHGPRQANQVNQSLKLPKQFREFLTLLEAHGYQYILRSICAQDYGVPQRRERVVLAAGRPNAPLFPEKTHGPGTQTPSYSAVWDWIGDLPPLAAGEEHASIPNHRAAGLSPLNLRRIQATPEGGSRMGWPEDLRLRCHPEGYEGYTDVYGRLRHDLPASGLTTRCISLSNGRFGHPTQHRALSVREAACLQTFPRHFIFHGSLNSMARQIGNAVPVLLATHFGNCFLQSLGVDPEQ
jgi:DNA (cytosine-5)-methyltransferase 1